VCSPVHSAHDASAVRCASRGSSPRCVRLCGCRIPLDDRADFDIFAAEPMKRTPCLFLAFACVPAALAACSFGVNLAGYFGGSDGAVVAVDTGTDAASRVPPSCAGDGGPGVSNCGNAESCCASPVVVGGEFLRSFDNVTAVERDYPATVSDYRLDRFETTVGRFRKFVAARGEGWVPLAGSGKHVHINGGAGLLPNGTNGPEPGWDSK
jgi:hypothetical protein